MKPRRASNASTTMHSPASVMSWRLAVDILHGSACNITCPVEVRPSTPQLKARRRRSSQGLYTLCNASGLLSGYGGRPCRVVSIGIGENWHFEDWLALSGCSIDAFDPTTRLQVKHAAHVTNRRRRGATYAGMRFHFAGLAGDTNNSLCHLKTVGDVPCHAFPAAVAALKEHGQTAAASYVRSNQQFRRLAVRTSFKYGLIAGEALLPLGALFRMASIPETSRVSVLKIDCEGCEWDAFAELEQTSPRLLGRVDQVVIELHLRVQFQLNGMDQLVRLLRHLLIDHGFRTISSGPSPGFDGVLSHTQAPDELTAASFETDKQVAVELSLMRPQPLPVRGLHC